VARERPAESGRHSVAIGPFSQVGIVLQESLVNVIASTRPRAWRWTRIFSDRGTPMQPTREPFCKVDKIEELSRILREKRGAR
jgi:hypothetical protein